VFGVKDAAALLETFKAYTLAPVAARINADVLIFAGTDDHFVPVVQVSEFAQSLNGSSWAA
jgi:dienelactone hydrolase